MEPLKLLLIEELPPGDPSLCEPCTAALGQASSTRRVARVADALALLRAETFHVVILDAGSRGIEVLESLENIRGLATHASLILLSDAHEEAMAAFAERHEDSFYLAKDARFPRTLASIVRCVAARKRAEEELANARHENRRLSTAIESVTVGVIIVDPPLPDSPMAFANPAFCEITGYASSEVIGRNCRFLQGPQTDRETVAQIRAALAERRPFHGTLLNYRKDGSTYWNSLSIAPTFDEAGELLSFVGIQRDVTAQVQEKERLERSEASLALSQQVARLGSWEIELDSDGEASTGGIHWSDETFRIFGYEPGAVTPTRAFYKSLVHPEDREEMEARFARMRRFGELFSMDQRLVCPDGTQRCVHVEAQLMPPAGGSSHPTIAGTVQDITERKRAEEALRESEERLQIVIENLTEGLIVADREGNLILWNQASLRMHDFTDPEQGRHALAEFASIFELCSLDGNILSIDAWPLSRIMRGERLKNYEVLIRKIGTEWERVFSYGGAIVHDSNAQPVAFVTVNDITERKRAELTATRLAAIVESSDDAIIGKTLEGRITSWNRGAAALYGYTAEEAIGRSINFLVPPEGIADERLLLERIGQGEHLHHFETVRIRKGGASLNVSMTVSPVRDHSGHVVGISAISRDITEGKQAEAALRASELRYQRIVLNVPGMVYQAVRRLDGVFEFPFISE